MRAARLAAPGSRARAARGSAPSRTPRRRHGLDADRLRLDEVAGQHRERAPGEREAPVVVDAPAEPARGCRRARARAPTRDEGEQARGPTRPRPRSPIATAPASATTAAPTSAGCRDLGPERPAVKLVERVGGDAEREEERGRSPRRSRSVWKCGASAAPSATYERCQACTADGAASPSRAQPPRRSAYQAGLSSGVPTSRSRRRGSAACTATSSMPASRHA